jgi:hypothetical protein
MANLVVDNLIALRILYLLVTPFVKTKAYEYKIIDDKGNYLKKYSELKTTAERQSFSYLHRLVFKLKRLLAKLPGGDNRLKSLVAALYLIKEFYIKKESLYLVESRYNELLLSNETLSKDEQEVKEFLNDFYLIEKVNEDIANVSGVGVSTDQPVVSKKAARRYAMFNVKDAVYNKFKNGKTKWTRWSEYLNLEDEGEAMIYNFARKNPKGIIVLKNGNNIKAIRFNRFGGGNWSSITRNKESDIANVVATELN